MKIISFAKKYSFFFLLFVFITLINSSHLEPFLDNLIGISWSSGFVGFLKTNTQGFLVLFLISLYFEIIRSKKTTAHFSSTEIFLSNGVVDVLAKIDIRNIFKILLGQFYPKNSANNDMDSLVDIVLPEKNIYTDVRVKYTLTDSETDESKYILKYEIEFTSNLNEYVIAIVAHSEIQERISNTCPKICDVITIPTLHSSFDDFQRIASQINITKIGKDSSGNSIKTPLKLMQLTSKSQILKYTKGISNDEIEKMIILFEKLNSNINDHSTILVSTPEIQLDKSDHYVYWIADRPMWVNCIEFDFSKFTFGGKKNFNVQPIIPSYKCCTNSTMTESKFTILIHNWLVNGNGIIFSWR